MKILIDARLYGLENAGLGRYVMNLARELSKLDKKNNYSILLRTKYFNKLKFPKNWKKVEAGFRHYSLSEQVKLPKLVKELNPDLVHFTHFNVPLLIKIPFVVTIHDIVMHKQKGPEATTLPLYFYKIKRLGYKKVFKKAVFSSLKIIVPTNFVSDEIVRYYKIPEDKVIVTYEGVDKPIYAKNEKRIIEKYKLNSEYYIYTGNAYPHKNLVRAIEAITLVNESAGKKIIFAIASSRSVFSKRLKKAIDRLKANQYVRLLGFVPDRELNVLYKNSLGFVYPSLYEGFGLPGLEAMAAGTTALVSEIPVFREIYGDAATYFNPFDFTSIAKTMKDILEIDPKKRAALIKKGQKFVQRYSWPKMAKETLKVYESAFQT